MTSNLVTLPNRSVEKKSLIERVLRVSQATGDDARRRRLLNMVLLAIFILSGLLVIIGILQLSLSNLPELEIEATQSLVISSLVMVGVVGVLYGINRFYSGAMAGVLLVLLLTVAISFSDSPEQLTEGRSTFFLALPIMMASVALRPRFTFFAATIVIVPLILLTEDPLRNLNYAAVTGFYIVALLSWLAASSLESALKELRIINAELDERVEQRTAELNVALGNVQRESKKNEAILSSIADGVVVLDMQGQASVANAAISQLLDVPTQQIIGANIGSLTASQLDRETLSQNLMNHKIEIGERTLSVSVAPVQIENQDSRELVAVFRDFTRETQLNRMKDVFVSMASHELRTPLNAIIGYADMLKEGVYGEINAEQNRFFDRIMANTKRMLSLVNNMLDQAQISVGKLSLNINRFRLDEMAEEVDSVVSVLAESKGLDFNFTCEDDMPDTLVGDKERLVQIIINLTGNAVKFTDKGSINVTAKRNGTEAWDIIIQDTGRGIPKHMQDTIFMPFEQVDDTYTRNTGGTGLGLSIVRLLTDLMGGEITLESALNVGSTFTIHLPMTIKQEETES